MDFYEINAKTLAIISMGNEISKVLEDEQSLVIAKNSFDILDHSCRFFGSSYAGRKAGSLAIMGLNYKVPIVVEDSQNLIFFPTTSPEDDECIWLAVNKIRSYKKQKYNTSKVIFENGMTLNVPLSYESLQNQILRASRLSYLLISRKLNYTF